ncbi:MAG: hypothetical protein ABR589_01305 [Chthoniobacterales bacterium]
MIQRSEWQRRVSNFAFPPEADFWLAILRCGLGIQLCLYCLWLRSDWEYFIGGSGRGIVGRQISEGLVAAEAPFVPTFGWLVDGAEKLGLTEQTTLLTSWLTLLLAGALLLAGLFSRVAAITAWFLHLCAAKSGGFFAYGVDNFMTIGLFYLMIGPLPDRYSLDSKLWRRGPPDPELLGFFRRLLQVHLGIAYFFSGLSKALGSGWWDGSSIWRAFIRPPFNFIPAEVLVRGKHLLPLIGICILVLELGYPLMMSVRKFRTLWLALILGMHVAIGLTLGMYLFALIMIVLNIAAFGPTVSSNRRRASSQANSPVAA